jgi:hypothetical protein
MKLKKIYSSIETINTKSVAVKIREKVFQFSLVETKERFLFGFKLFCVRLN